MEWLNRMLSSIEYIEAHLEHQLDLNEAAKAAYSSPFHYHRMFHMLTGITVGEYVRRRRLTLAAQELASSDIKVLDAALKYGYDSPEAFSKAFRRLHGVSPSTARESGAALKAFPRLSFQISIKGDKDMDYRIVERKEYKVVGKALRFRTDNGENFVKIPKFWEQCWQDGTCKELLELTGCCGDLLGVCMEPDEKMEEFTYIIGVAGQSEEVPAGYVVKDIPASTWAVFESIGAMPDAIQAVWKRVFSEWFPATGYEHAGGPEVEVYPEGDTCSKDYRCEVWIPIIKK